MIYQLFQFCIVVHFKQSKKSTHSMHIILHTIDRSRERETRAEMAARHNSPSALLRVAAMCGISSFVYANRYTVVSCSVMRKYKRDAYVQLMAHAGTEYVWS